MTTASQKTSGALPPETPTPLNEAPLAVRAAEGVLTAAMEAGKRTPRELAQAEHDTGILFDPKRAQDIADAAAEQAHAEDQADIEGCRAELAAARRELAAMAGAQRRVDAVTRLIESRPGSYRVAAAEIGVALEYGTTPYDAFPMTLTWSAEDGVDVPGPGDTGRRAIVKCRSVHGQLADLVIEGDDRPRLAALVDEPADGAGPCPTDGCGTVEDYDPTDMYGWARLEVAGVEDDRPRWYCTPHCVATALTRAGEELAAADRAADIDPGQQDPGPLYGGDVAQFISDAYDSLADQEADAEHLSQCVRCGCTDEAACEGGCAWVPNTQLIDLCSRCANPAELKAAGWTVSGE